MYKDARQIHHILYGDLSKLQEKFNQSNLAEKIDIVYGLQKTSETLTDIRKQIDKLESRLSTFACLEMQHENLQSIKTPFCSAKVKVEQFASLPTKREKDPDKFDALMSSMGIPADVFQSEGVRFHWPGFKEYFTKRQAEGFPMPDGIDVEDVYTEYTLQTRKIKEPDED